MTRTAVFSTGGYALASGPITVSGDCEFLQPMIGRTSIWTVQASGARTQTLRWTPDTADWTVVAVNGDSPAGLTMRASVGYLAPFLLQLAIEMLAAGVVLAAMSAALTVVPVRRAAAAGRRQA